VEIRANPCYIEYSAQVTKNMDKVRQTSRAYFSAYVIILPMRKAKNNV